jgi:hypothetical protein
MPQFFSSVICPIYDITAKKILSILPDVQQMSSEDYNNLMALVNYSFVSEILE